MAKKKILIPKEPLFLWETIKCFGGSSTIVNFHSDY
jgi:hypothetical protein